ncbi:MAG: glycosyltransferase [Candidatus Omnitrophica bacterium]|nr:glycosyltransferase [Candidatus Omnitrophota bacterium]
MPLVSVIIATYNRAHFIKDAIESVLRQTFNDYEIIIVDDGSTDDTKEVVRQFAGKVRYCYQENKGRSESRNTGIRLSQGEYVAFLDDDDIWAKDKIKKQLDYFSAHPEIGLVHSFTDVIDAKGQFLPAETKERIGYYEKAIKFGSDYKGLSRLCIMFLSTVIFKKKLVEGVGLFDPDIPAFEDWDFYLRFSLKYRIGLIAEPLASFRMHGLQSNKEEFFTGRIKTSMKHLAIIDSFAGMRFRRQLRYNFIYHIASAYYIHSDLCEFRKYALKALVLKPLDFLSSRSILHLMASFLPRSFIKIFRRR